jgi:preprotein translocase subunit SecG
MYSTSRADSLPDVIVVVLIVQVLSSFGLLGLVLLHSGKGGGLSDMFGGGMGAAAAGSTVVEKNLDRITVLVAIVFAFSTLALALMLDE